MGHLRYIFSILYMIVTYYSANFLNSLRSDHLKLLFQAELAIPLIDWMILPYFLAYPLLALPLFLLDSQELSLLAKSFFKLCTLAFVIYLALPTQCEFPRDIAKVSYLKELYLFLWSSDHPYNLLPSMHVMMACYSLVPCLEKLRGASYMICLSLLLLICSSILFTHQHHLIDLMVGLGLSYTFLKVSYFAPLKLGISIKKPKKSEKIDKLGEAA